MFTKEEIALVKPCIEAIKKITERQEEECPQCKGRGNIVIGRLAGAGAVHPTQCSICDGTGKVKGKWEWEPEVGEWCIYRNKCYLIVKCGAYEMWLNDPDYSATSSAFLVKKIDCIPLLHWERVRKILKQFGYSFSITSGASGGQITVYKNIGTDKVYEKYHNNDLQREVMVAVIELGKGE